MTYCTVCIRKKKKKIQTVLAGGVFYLATTKEFTSRADSVSYSGLFVSVGDVLQRDVIVTKSGRLESSISTTSTGNDPH